jgi:hypothetical protein
VIVQRSSLDFRAYVEIVSGEMSFNGLSSMHRYFPLGALEIHRLAVIVPVFSPGLGSVFSCDHISRFFSWTGKVTSGGLLSSGSHPFWFHQEVNTAFAIFFVSPTILQNLDGSKI